MRRIERGGGEEGREALRRVVMAAAGTKERRTGEIYWGDFENGKYHGYGVVELPDSSIYKGQFKEGKYHGNRSLSRRTHARTHARTQQARRPE